MASSTAPTVTSRNPSLVAILLVAQGRLGSGAQVVFHYPPHPLSAESHAELAHVSDDEDDASSSSDSDQSSSEDNLDHFKRHLQTAAGDQQPRSPRSDDDEGTHAAQKDVRRARDWKPSWEPLLGLGEDDLVTLLAPGRAWHKRRFELGFNDMTFLSRPVYAREDGQWRKSAPSPGPPRETLDHDEHRRPSSGAVESLGPTKDDESADRTGAASPAGHFPAGKAGAGRDATKSHLAMFNAVFVMDPQPLEHGVRVKDMYDHVVKKFSKALKWEQTNHNYVWDQVELLQSIQAIHVQQQSPTKAVYAEMLRRSSLAAAIAKIFDSVAASKIAAITLSPKLSVSLQIPPVTSTSYMPTLSEPPLEPGLWLTTATDPASTASDLDATSSAGALQLSKNFTLLLKATPQKILKDVQVAGGPLALPLATFIAQATPTKSFYKISVASRIALGDIQHLARHLVYWRRAVAIPPLHQLDTYMVSPNANMAKLAAACKAYEASFPMMPSLPKMLSSLSGSPAPYGMLIPSRDHKEEYYRALAWLLRDGWVTQLRTFAYVRVDPDVKQAVRDRERDEPHRAKTPVDRDHPRGDPDGHRVITPRSFGSGPPTPGSNLMSSMRPRPSLVSRASSDGRQSISTDHTSTQGVSAPRHDPKAASLILSPQRASFEESAWLDYIGSHLLSWQLPSRVDAALPSSPESMGDTDTETAELRRHWPSFVKYFNGAEALERIPGREGLKRRYVWDMLNKMGLAWGDSVEAEPGQNQRILVAVRHW